VRKLRSQTKTNFG